MKGKIGLRICALGVALCTMLAGCGAGEESKSPAYTMGGASEQASDASKASSSETIQSVKYITEEELLAQVDQELEEKGYSAAEETKGNRETLTMGVYYNFVDTNMKKTVGNFNLSQEQYWLEIKEYDSHSNLVMDIMRGEGADLFSLKHMSFDIFADAGVLEDLTPYFEESETISKEQVVESVWRAGSWEGKYMGVIPYFNPAVYLVEKDYTDNGGWTLEEYFGLGDKYPDAKLENRVKELNYYLVNFFEVALQSFVDWEEMTCDFENESFRNLLVKIKENAGKEYETKGAGTIAEALYEKEYLTTSTYIHCNYSRKMSDYITIRDTFLDAYDMVGIPNAEGLPMYDMLYYEMYGMNALSEHKDAAWAFIEYLFSEEYQSDVDSSSFTVRSDLLEEMLESEINFVFPHEIYTNNRYTGEKVQGSTLAPFTEEDKENLLYIIDNCYRNTMHYSEIYYIVKEEADYFFAGDKELDEVVKIIQSRANLYMEEIKIE